MTEPSRDHSLRWTKRYWLEAPGGRVTIGAWAVLIGRSHDCNIVLEQPDVSRHHLLVRVGQHGPEMLPLGRDPVRLNDSACTELSALRSGDRIGVGAWSFVVGEGEVEYSPRTRDVSWFLERQSGLLHQVRAPVFQVGGDVDDDLTVEGWRRGVFAISLRSGRPVLTPLVEGVTCGRPLEEGERFTLTDGSEITYRGHSLVVRARQAPQATPTFGTAPPSSAVVVALEFLPRGGRLTIDAGGRLRSTLLSDRRCDLVACLLRPPFPFSPGDLVPEEVLCERVWPGEKNGRMELNSLLYRLRHNLEAEGIDPTPLFERAGGGLRFCLAPGARVVVK